MSEITFSELMSRRAVALQREEEGYCQRNLLSSPYNVSDNCLENGDGKSHRKNGISDKNIRQYRRLTIEGSLDLHGFTVDNAYVAVEEFLSLALSRYWRKIEIIHGRGTNSTGGVGVLRTEVRQWLSHSHVVLAFFEPRYNAGAIEVILRKRRGD